MTHHTPIIGLVGGIGAGKSTVANVLCEQCGFTGMSFAGQLKGTCTTLCWKLGVHPRHFFGNQADKAEPIPQLGGVTGRRFLELVGTNGFRAAYDRFWVDLALAMAEEFESVVFEDVRFQNEAEAIRERGGWIWYVRRVGGPPQEKSDHASDQEWTHIPVDGEIVAAYGDMESLRAQAHTAAARARVGGARLIDATPATLQEGQ